MANEKWLIDPHEYKSFLERYIKELYEVGAPMIAGAVERCLYKLEAQPTVDAVEVVRCSYCDPDSKDYNPCWLCKKGGTAHDVEHCHSTNYGDYEPMQPHCHLCGRKL